MNRSKYKVPSHATLISKVIVYGSRKADIEERIFSLIAKIVPKNQDTVFVHFSREKEKPRLMLCSMLNRLECIIRKILFH